MERPFSYSAFPYSAFLGAAGENDDLLERVLLEFLRDHVYWRRNFHPEDPPPIPTYAHQEPDFQQFADRLRTELRRLSASLKRSVPFYSPRYMGHMVSDVLLPGLLAQMVTLPYNPNNVVDEAAPVTVELELEAGLQLARMMGMPTDTAEQPCAFGHLTSGGTVANYEAVWLQRALKFFPPALAAAWREAGKPFPLLVERQSLDQFDDWALFNLSNAQIIQLRMDASAEIHGLPAAERRRFLTLLEDERLETLGMADFMQRHPDVRSPVVGVPVTAHYSWQKAMKLLGLGKRQLMRIPEWGMRMEPGGLEEMLAHCHRERIPVLMIVGILGTTEFGTLDPVDRIIAARDAWQAKGLGFGVHVDAAWGGYLASMFRNPDGSLRTHDEVRHGLKYFPSENVYRTFAALGRADSITVDPHKLGYLPYGAGAFITRDWRAMDFVAESASYVFTDRTDHQDPKQKFRSLGRYILEGSKSGAAAAAVYVTHATLPLDHENFGRIPKQTVRASEKFFDRVHELAETVADVAHVTVPFEPDTNLVCLAFNPKDNRDLAKMNAFSRRVYNHLKVDSSQPLQVKEFFGSCTSLSREAMGPEEFARVMQELELDQSTFTDSPDRPEIQSDHMFIFRHTLMNPWLIDTEEGVDYIDHYCQYLEQLIRQEVNTPVGVRPIAWREEMQ